MVEKKDQEQILAKQLSFNLALANGIKDRVAKKLHEVAEEKTKELITDDYVKLQKHDQQELR